MGSANSADTLEPTIATSTPKKHDARRHAYLAYLHIMTKPNHPQVGTAEHRAIKLFRDYYPNARANGKSSKFRSARMATIRRFQKEHDSKILPPKVWKAILRGVSKMGAALTHESVFDALTYEYAVSDEKLQYAIEHLLVLPEQHGTTVVRATS